MAEARDLRKDIVGSQNQHFPHSEKESRFYRRRSTQTREMLSSESERTVGASKQCNKMFMSVFCLFLVLSPVLLHPAFPHLLSCIYTRPATLLLLTLIIRSLLLRVDERSASRASGFASTVHRH